MFASLQLAIMWLTEDVWSNSWNLRPKYPMTARYQTPRCQKRQVSFMTHKAKIQSEFGKHGFWFSRSNTKDLSFMFFSGTAIIRLHSKEAEETKVTKGRF